MDKLKDIVLKIWKDPVWSKIIAAVILTLAGAFFTIIKKYGKNQKNFILKTWKYPVWITIITMVIISLAVAFGGIKSCRNIVKKVINQIDSEKKSDDSSLNNAQTESIKKQIILVDELPYSTNIPILDKTIYIKYNYNDFLIGGKNIKKLKISARTFDAHDLKPNYKHYPNEIEYYIHDKPYIEFEYLGQFYFIKVDGKRYNYKYILGKVSKTSMDLMMTDFD